MTRLPAAPAMTDLAGAILPDGPDGPDEMPGIAVGLPLVVNAVADEQGTGRAKRTVARRAPRRVAAIAAGT